MQLQRKVLEIQMLAPRWLRSVRHWRMSGIGRMEYLRKGSRLLVGGGFGALPGGAGTACGSMDNWFSKAGFDAIACPSGSGAPIFGYCWRRERDERFSE